MPGILRLFGGSVVLKASFCGLSGSKSDEPIQSARKDFVMLQALERHNIAQSPTI